MSNPEDLALDYLVTYLEADTTLMGLVNGIGPNTIWDSLRSPFVRVDYLDGEDLMVVGLHRVWADTTWHIRGCELWQGQGRPDRTTINAVGARIDELLHDHEEQTATLEMHSFREEPCPDPAVVTDGDLWLQSGGIYRLRARALTAA